MKKEILIGALFTLSCLGIFLLTFSFYHRSISSFDHLTSETHKLQHEVFYLEADIAFLRHQERELKFLETAGWLIPQSRLLSQEMLEELGKNFDKVDYIFEPEQIIAKGGSYSYKSTKILWSGEALFDSDIFDFLEDIFSKFPGILTLQEMTLTRSEAPQRFILGKLIFEWTAFKREAP
jgi:hypothetical protein